MWPDRRLCGLLHTEHPIVQAPMAGSDSPALAAAVANAGGLGSLGCAMMSPQACRTAWEAARAASNGALNLNFFAHRPPRRHPEREARAAELLAPFYDEFGLEGPPRIEEANGPFGEVLFETVMDLRPPVVSFHFGLPDAAFVAAMKDAGIHILCSATTPAEARQLERARCQGWEAGGHQGFYLQEVPAQIGTFALVPQIVDAVTVPVIAAGGIADGRGIAAALALGAAGVQIGTAFLTCPESAALPAHRRALLAAESGATRMTRAFSGRPARGIVNRYMEAMAPHEPDLPEFPLLNAGTGPLRRASAAADSPDFVSLWSGQAAPLNRELPAAELVAALVAETEEAFARLGR